MLYIVQNYAEKINILRYHSLLAIFSCVWFQFKQFLIYDTLTRRTYPQNNRRMWPFSAIKDDILRLSIYDETRINAIIEFDRSYTIVAQNRDSTLM